MIVMAPMDQKFWVYFFLNHPVLLKMLYYSNAILLKMAIKIPAAGDFFEK